MKDTFLGLGIFVILIFGFVFHIRSQIAECFTSDGTKICTQLLPSEIIESQLIFGHQYQITNNSAEIFFVPMRTETEFFAFLAVTNVGNQNFDIDICGASEAFSLSSITIPECFSSPPPPTPKSCHSLLGNVSLYSNNSGSGNYLGKADSICKDKQSKSSCETYQASPAGQDPLQTVCEWR